MDQEAYLKQRHEWRKGQWLLAIARESGKQGLSISELARRSGIRRATVSTTLSGKKDPKMETLRALWYGLGFTGNDLEPGEILVDGLGRPVVTNDT